MNKGRERAYRIAAREAEKERIGRLTTILVQQLSVSKLLASKIKGKAKNKPEPWDPLPKGFLTRVVTEYLKENPSVVRSTAELLVDLSVRVKKQYSERKKLQQNLVASQIPQVDESLTTGGIAHVSALNVPPKTDNVLQSVSLDSVNPWTLIQTLKVIEAEEAVKTEKAKTLEKQREMLAALSDHVQTKKESILREKQELNLWKEEQERELIKWKQDKERMERMEKERVIELCQVRRLQMNETLMLRKKEREMARNEQLKEIKDIQLSLEKEEERKRLKKEQERRKWEKIKEENARVILERERLKLLAAKEEAKLMAEMKAKLDRHEASRVKALQDRILKAEAFGRKLCEAGTFNEKEEEKKFELKLLQEAREREQAQVEEQRKKKAASEERLKSITASNLKMVEERKAKDREIELQEEKYALQCARERDALLAEKESNRNKENETKRQYSKLLNEQVQEQKQYETSAGGMTSVERSINKKVSNANTYVVLSIKGSNDYVIHVFAAFCSLWSG